MISHSPHEVNGLIVLSGVPTNSTPYTIQPLHATTTHCISEIAQSKALPVSDTLPQTPITHPLSSVNSTPNTTLSPSFTPFTTPNSSPQSAAIAVVLAQANSSFQYSPSGASPTGSSPIQPTSVLVPNNMSPSSLSGLSSPQTTASLITNSICGKNMVPIAVKQPSHSSVKAVLHSHCPSNQPECVSPLIKSSFANMESTEGIQSSPLSLTTKSPSAKFVTVSKVSNDEHLTSILQQLQQNPNISKLLSASTLHHFNGNGTSS